MHLRLARPFALVALSGLTTVLACFPIDVSFDDDEPSAKVAVLRGVVTSTRGEPLESVLVADGKTTATTDDHGRYELKPNAGKNRVRFALDGYVDSVRSLNLPDDHPTQLDVSLLPRAEPVALAAAQGGTVTGERGAAVRAGEDAFAGTSGKPVTGTVDVYLSAFDPSSQTDLAAAPELVTLVDGDTQLLESLGIVEIRIEQDAKKLSIAADEELELSIPVSDGVQPPAAVDFWRYEEDDGIWLRDGKAKLDVATQTYVGSVTQPGLWSAGAVYSATCICGVVEETDEGPLGGARIEAYGVSYYGSSHEQSDGHGRFCIAVRKDSDVDVTAYHASEGGESKRIHTKSASTLVPPASTDARCEDVGTWRVTKSASSG